MNRGSEHELVAKFGTRHAKLENGTLAPLAVRVIEFKNALGKFYLTFPKGHAFAEDSEKIVASYEKDTLTIHKANVSHLRVTASYPREPSFAEAKEE